MVLRKRLRLGLLALAVLAATLIARRIVSRGKKVPVRKKGTVSPTGLLSPRA